MVHPVPLHLFVLAALVLLLQGPLQFAAGQGLAVTNDVLSADAELVAQQFSIFEGAAELAVNLGGRGRGGRGSSSNLGECARPRSWSNTLSDQRHHYSYLSACITVCFVMCCILASHIDSDYN
jgi:hypothetical protein